MNDEKKKFKIFVHMINYEFYYVSTIRKFYFEKLQNT